MGNDFAKNGTWKIYERRKARRVKTRRKTELRKFMENEKEEVSDGERLHEKWNLENL